jgi:uncharacterized protein YndB with AHSA1/START domain
MPRTDRAPRVISAPVARVFKALVDRVDLETWLPPGGMTASFEGFDASPGGSYRLVLTYTDPTESRAKSSEYSDIVDARYVDIVPNDWVVQEVDFVSDDSTFAGTMTMTWAVHAVEGGTRVAITPDDHAAGLPSSLDNLAAYLES